MSEDEFHNYVLLKLSELCQKVRDKHPNIELGFYANDIEQAAKRMCFDE